MKLLKVSILLLSFSIVTACTSSGEPMNEVNETSTHETQHEKDVKDLTGLSKAYFASGCFWCVEAIFESVKGVEEVISGYSGGEVKNPTYELIGTGTTKHAEAVEIYYNPEIVSFETLVKVFFGSHDPTTPNRQGPDRGPQYRSVAFYQNDAEKEAIVNQIKELTEAKTFNAKIVTEITPFEVFYNAEDYHQDYERNHPENPYVRSVSIPRLNKFKSKFPDLLK